VRGKGSRFVLTLPKRVTTQILPGYLMRLRGQLFVVPLDRVRETFRIADDEISTMGNRGRCLMRHGEVLPLLSLADALDLKSMASVARATAVTLEAKGRRLAIEVDQGVGVQKVVVRSIRGLPATNRLLGGGALMGDGSVALILNVDALAEC
jgi:two-component system chemotaxis sensor kinase CheA